MKLKDLPLGAELRFGSYGFTEDTVEPITWSLVDKSGILFSKYVIGQIEYNRECDAFYEEDTSYENSDIRAFLNSRVLRDSDNVPGFLTFFDPDEIRVLLPLEIANCEEDVVSIPSMYNIGFTLLNPSGISEQMWSKYDVTGMASESMVKHPRFSNDGPKIAGAFWWYWLRDISGEYDVFVATKDCDVSRHYSDDQGIGFRPYIRLSPDIEVVGPNLGGTYQVVCGMLSRHNRITKEDLLDILNV